MGCNVLIFGLQTRIDHPEWGSAGVRVIVERPESPTMTREKDITDDATKRFLKSNKPISYTMPDPFLDM